MPENLDHGANCLGDALVTQVSGVQEHIPVWGGAIHDSGYVALVVRRAGIVTAGLLADIDESQAVRVGSVQLVLAVEALHVAHHGQR